ncbi:MAG: tRNA-binding protein [Bacteroidota bacterium]|nr:tRNA-binding protein [Bacteroidota bacterium]
MSEIVFEDFQKIDLRVGTIVAVQDFPKALKPAYKLSIDFGPLGIKKSSAQITALYRKEALVGKQIIANVNFAEKQIANFKSQCLILGAVDKDKVILLNPSIKVPNGSVVQ